MKVMAIQDTTKSFVITKMLCGMERKHKRVNARKPITFEISNSNEISSILNMCLSEFWDSANSPTLKKTKNTTEKQAAKSVAS
jgi:hypothetical protein